MDRDPFKEKSLEVSPFERGLSQFYHFSLPDLKQRLEILTKIFEEYNLDPAKNSSSWEAHVKIIKGMFSFHREEFINLISTSNMTEGGLAKAKAITDLLKKYKDLPENVNLETLLRLRDFIAQAENLREPINISSYRKKGDLEDTNA